MRELERGRNRRQPLAGNGLRLRADDRIRGPRHQPTQPDHRASLADLGYVVNLAAADPYTLAPGIRIAGSRRMLHLKNDIIRGPIRQVDASGRVVGVLSR